MATYRLRHFSNPGTLKSIAPYRLLGLLGDYSSFFQQRGCPLPAPNNAQDLDYSQLVDIFLNPDASTPRELLDALFLIDEMATPEAMDLLLDAVAESNPGLAIDSDCTPADVAVQVWLQDRDLLERKHAERHLLRPKSFEYFKTDRQDIPDLSTPAATTQRAIEETFDDWFEKKKRGRGSRLFVYPREDDVWFLIRHGQTFKREESLEGAVVESVCYRPLKYDVAVYNRHLGELRINADLVGEKKLYREQLAEHLFGDKQFFNINKKYTLEPLRQYGLASMACGDIEGIESITLTEVQFFWGGAYHEIEIRKASDVFASFEERGSDLPESPLITKAVLKVKFTDSKTARSVTIRPPNVAQYTRDSDALVLERWLEQRGFIVHAGVGSHAAVA
jgi:hypothetical protein